MIQALKLPFAKKLMEVQTLRPLETYRVFVTVVAATLSLEQSGNLKAETLRGVKPSDQDLLARAFALLVDDMEAHPYRDLLGPLYMEIGHQLDKKFGGEYFTPHELSVLLARMTFGGANPRSMFKPGEILMASEPACGSGGMVLAATQVLADAKINPLTVRWVAQDINPMSCYAAFLNFSLWGIPARVLCGNTLSDAPPHWQWQTFAWNKAFPLIPLDSEEAKLRRMLDAVRGLIGHAVSTSKPQERQPAPFGPQFGPLFGGES